MPLSVPNRGPGTELALNNCSALGPRGDCSVEELLRGHLHVLVPQTVDKGIQHGDDHPAHQGSCLVLLGGGERCGLQVHGEDGAIEQGHHGEVGATSGQGFPFAPSGRNLEDCPEDAGVREEDAREWADAHEDAESKDHQLIGVRV